MAYVDTQVVTNHSNAPVMDAPVDIGSTPDQNPLVPDNSQNAVEQYIRQRAAKYGVDPDVAVRVARSEALNVFDPSKPDRGGDEGSSFGPFQLHYSGMSKSMPHAGLGDEFTKTTGLDARDPSTWRQQVDFSLGYAGQHGWGSWMGAKNSGIGNMEGINGQGVGGDLAMTKSSSAPAQSAMGGDAATPSSTNQFPPPPRGANAMSNPAMKRLLMLTYLKSALQGVQLQKVDYDPFAVLKG